MKDEHTKSIREKAEDHWKFLEKLLKIESGDGMIDLETAGYLYVEAMIHGYKHREQESK